MSGNLLFIFDHPIITRQLNILTNQTTALIVCSVLIPQDLVGPSLIGHLKIEF